MPAIRSPHDIKRWLIIQASVDVSYSCTHGESRRNWIVTGLALDSWHDINSGGLEVRAAEVRSDLDEHGGYVAGRGGCQGPNSSL